MAGKRATRLSSSTTTTSRPKRMTTTTTSSRGPNTRDSDDSFGDDHDASDPEARPTKKRKSSSARTGKQSSLPTSLFETGPITHPDPCAPATGRHHSLSYHKPLLLCQVSGLTHRRSLLSWFDSVSTARAMPWRKSWINPNPDASPTTDRVREQLARRAYEVWISEIMLQQTRVAVVIGYWKRWMEKWPTIHDLAAADVEDVLAAWRGLGYYSRATRIHEAAKIVVHDETMRGLLPAATADLEAKVPGVGRYTAGAISAIVFGRAAPMVDGNVLRVLSRQLGIYGNIKTDKRVIDAIWTAADALAKAVSQDREDGEDPESTASDRPGRWGQALMELGSTICTPKPNCAACPVTRSCRVYGEAKTMTTSQPGRTGRIPDMEDGCTLCEPFEEDVLDHDHEPEAQPPRERKTKSRSAQPDKTQGGKKPKQMTLAAFAFTGNPAKRLSSASDHDKQKEAEARERKEKEQQEQEQEQEAISNYARKFPIKTAKKPVRVEQEIVCAIQRHDGSFLIRRRPEKGLLAGLWEFPSTPIPAPETCSPARRSEMARTHAASMLRVAPNRDDGRAELELEYRGELGSVPWLFSHIKLTMHVHMFRFVSRGDIDVEGAASLAGRPWRWTLDVEGESMGTDSKPPLEKLLATGLVSRPTKSSNHYTIIRHSHGLVWPRGPKTSLAITILAGEPLPANRILRFQQKGYSGNMGMSLKALMAGPRDEWIGATPVTEAQADHIPGMEDRPYSAT
ncbi:hypothetical protein E4U43_003347 [Claviceps pusilla]|uniref:Adenine DNA glycosylase n=1 Tax=Claviceps pusilla TaxID=123648 RepID=A0A9P7N646_9HYPO|nr:hypothetical protein E4U43_003347 [Claviceps pusilla]